MAKASGKRRVATPKKAKARPPKRKTASAPKRKPAASKKRSAAPKGLSITRAVKKVIGLVVPG